MDGSSRGWSSSAKAFLLNRTKLAQYDVLFVDCAAAEYSGDINLGSSFDARQIADNLKEFVDRGGGVHASDWAFLFLALGDGRDSPGTGRVTYTAFHNIAQPTGDVEAILRYLVFHL